MIKRGEKYMRERERVSNCVCTRVFESVYVCLREVEKRVRVREGNEEPVRQSCSCV